MPKTLLCQFGYNGQKGTKYIILFKTQTHKCVNEYKTLIDLILYILFQNMKKSLAALKYKHKVLCVTKNIHISRGIPKYEGKLFVYFAFIG